MKEHNMLARDAQCNPWCITHERSVLKAFICNTERMPSSLTRLRMPSGGPTGLGTRADSSADCLGPCMLLPPL
eukprot:scaffold211855_cov12-Tisochrysis_lutea.AAC.1